ncbi:MAG: hypothetical protein WCE94_07790 [Candidatus Methanoperedens sp.]
MNKRRISTTISTKHWELLKKHTTEFETQQKVIEYALDGLENGAKQAVAMSREEELWMRIGREVKSTCLIQKDGLKELIGTVDIGRYIEYVSRHKPVECVIEYYYQKPLKECSLKEVIDGIAINARISNWFDTINYTDDGGQYTLKMTHTMGINCSKMLNIVIESVFETYGVKTESKISESSLFVKVFKNV